MKTYDYGIDLGTSNSSIAFAHEGKVELFKDSSPPYVDVIPSAYMLDPKTGAEHVGGAAYAKSWREKNVATKFKRALGTNQQFKLVGASKDFSPEELSGKVLSKLKSMAAEKGHVVDRAIICTPAKFSSVQVEGTRAAARLAGIEHVEMISEPMAASFGYGFTTERKGKWLVYDLGSGTFDAVVVQNQKGRLNTLDIEGDNQLGGTDMDRLMWDSLVLPRLAKEINRAIDDPALSAIRKAGLFQSELLKIALSTANKVTFNTLDLPQPLLLDGEQSEVSFVVSREELDRLIEPLITRSLEICRKLKLKHPDMSALLLIGGPTYMPFVRESVATLGLDMQTSVNPMTAVASGAALYAATIPVKVSPPSISPSYGTDSATGPVKLQVDFDPTSEDIEAPVVICGEDSRAVSFELLREPNYTSGKLALDGMPKPLMVPVAPGKTNRYRIKVFGSDLRELPCEPAEFSIFNGLTTSAPPLPESFRVEIRNPDDEERHAPVMLIKKGTPLRAKGTITLKTAVELNRNSGANITVKIWEGDGEALRADRLAFLLTIDGSQLRSRLPAKSEVDITLRVDASRTAEAEAFVSLLDQTFSIPAVGVRLDTKNPDQLEDRRDWLAGQINSLDDSLDQGPSKRQLELLRERLFSPETNTAFKLAKGDGSDGGDATTRIDSTLRAVEGRFVQLRELEEDQTLPRLWEEQKAEVGAMLEWPLATNEDRRIYTAVTEAGNEAAAAKKKNRLRSFHKELHRLGFRILGRDEGFWRQFFKRMNKQVTAYVDPQQARKLMDVIDTTTEFDELRSSIIALHSLRPIGAGGGDAIEDSKLSR